MSHFRTDPHSARVEWYVTRDGNRWYGYRSGDGYALGPWFDYATTKPIIVDDVPRPDPRGEPQYSELLCIDLSPTPERIALWVSLRLGR